MTELSLKRNRPLDLEPLARLLRTPEDMALVNPNAKFPFDPMEWHETWLAEPDDASFYLVDETGAEVGFFALRTGVGPEVRHMTYVFVAPAARGGAGGQLATLAERAARELGALTISLKVELDNPTARNAYLSAGYEYLGESGGMATMRRDLDR